MVAVLERIVHSVTSWGRASRSQSQSVISTRGEPAPEVYRIGEYYADYSALTDAELAASDPDADELIARSRVVSSKRL